MKDDGGDGLQPPGIWRDERVAPILIDVAMSAGHTLSALRYPSSSGPAPAVCLFTPYRKEGAWLTYPSFATFEDYEVFIVDVTATGGSGGDFHGPWSAGEIDDAVEFLAWVADQPFCDGSTALIGASYSGLLQYHIAARRPPSLRCIAPSIAPLDTFRDFGHRGGIPSTMLWYASTYGLSGQQPTVARGLALGANDTTDPFDGPERRRRSATIETLMRIEVPTLCLGGLYDIFASAPITAFQQLTCPKRLVIGNWGHEPDISTVEREELVTWLAYWLRSEGEDPTLETNVVIHEAGDRTWHRRTSWPTAQEMTWHTHDLVSAPTVVPVVAVLEALPAPTSEPMSDPTIDAQIDSGLRLWGEAWATGTPISQHDQAFLGHAILALALRVNECDDIDAHARISLVRRDGSVEQVTEARLRASHRELDDERSVIDHRGTVIDPYYSHQRALTLEPDSITHLMLKFGPISLRLAHGESLRVGLTIVRADGDVRPASVTILPSSELRLPGLRRL